MTWLRRDGLGNFLILEADPRNVYIIAALVSSALPNTPDMDASPVVGGISKRFRIVHSGREPNWTSRSYGLEVEHDLRGTRLSGIQRDRANFVEA